MQTTVEERAVETLNGWLAENGYPSANTTVADWTIGAYEDAVVIAAPRALRSNRVYLVHGDRVAAFSPSSTTYADAYAQLIA